MEPLEWLETVAKAERMLDAQPDSKAARRYAYLVARACPGDPHEWCDAASNHTMRLAMLASCCRYDARFL